MAFAAHADISTRLEETLSATGQASATQLCAEATALICDAIGKEEAAVTGQALVICKGLTIKLVCRTMASPQGLVTASEGIGDRNRAERYSALGMELTDAEERQARGAVFGTLSGSSTPRALTDRIIDLAEGRDVDEVEVES